MVGGRCILEAQYHMARARTVVFSPDLAPSDAVVTKLCSHLGYEAHADTSQPADLAVYWDPHTWREPPPDLLRLAADIPAINLQCRDFSKTRVDDRFTQVFGRSLRVDPRRHTGQFVVKSDVNARHDGVIVAQPIADPGSDRVYQRVIDNETGGEMVVDLRTPVIGSRIPLVYKLYRPVTQRFGVDDSRAEIVETSDVYTDEEISLLVRFAAAMGIDYGELDVLRDRDDRQVWVVDANPTPWGPPRTLGPADQLAAVERLSAAFESLASELIEAHRRSGAQRST